jgi:hypothetical protein
MLALAQLTLIRPIFFEKYHISFLALELTSLCAFISLAILIKYSAIDTNKSARRTAIKLPFIGLLVGLNLQKFEVDSLWITLIISMILTIGAYLHYNVSKSIVRSRYLLLGIIALKLIFWVDPLPTSARMWHPALYFLSFLIMVVYLFLLKDIYSDQKHES